jgi:uncharacterized protein
MKYGLTEHQLNILYQFVILPLKANKASVWIFGSRARGDHQPFSDVDIMYEIDKANELPLGFTAKLKEDIEESRFPFKVDIVNLADIADSYKVGTIADRVAL